MKFRPIDTWPGEYTKPGRRRPAHTFSAPYGDTVDKLHAELRHLNARDIVLQIACQEHEIRVDGTGPLASAKPDHPGVIVSFDSTHGPLRYMTDVFSHWHANLRAIALGLEALRKVERYGITKRGEQYTGWKALPAPSGPSSHDQAVTAIAMAAGIEQHAVLADPTAAIRKAKARTHPDAGGTTEHFQAVTAAAEVLTESDTP